MDSDIDVERSRLYSVNRTFLVGLSLVAVQTILFTALFILSFGTRNIGVAGLGPVLPTLTI